MVPYMQSPSHRRRDFRGSLRTDNLIFPEIGMQSPESRRFSKPQILCIDDSEAQLWLRARVLEKNGFSVLNASTAVRALDLLRRNPVCLILSDHMLTESRGAELAVKMRRIKPHVPLVLYSGAPPDTLRNVDCFIQKDESVESFVAIIRGLVSRYYKQV